MPFDGYAVPAPGAQLACHDRGLVAVDPERLCKIAQVSPRLQVQLGRRERFGDDRDPKGFQGSARASASDGIGARHGWDSLE